MKYILGLIIVFLGITTSVMAPVEAQNTNSRFGNGQAVSATEKLAIGGVEDGDIIRDNKAITVIKGAVNRVLGLAGLVVLLMLLYGGILMVTAAGNEEGYGKGLKIVKSAAIGIAIIGTAWFIISIGLRLALQAGGAAEGTTGGTEQ